MHTRLRPKKLINSLPNYIKVAAFTVSKKPINTQLFFIIIIPVWDQINLLCVANIYSLKNKIRTA